MSKSKGTKRSLLASLTSLLLCVAMLIGSTFAWFTDTASTAVNKIQAGNLNVGLYYKDADSEWQNAEGQKLGWVQAKASDGTTTEIVSTEGLPLWEPGCTFTLPELKIVNNGDLALKYKIVISGITGSAKLLDVIDWTMKVDGKDETLGNEHTLVARAANATETDANYDIFTISGHMKEDAGNEYQGLSIDGIAITVYATQVEGEYDSSTDDYDADAKYDIQITETATGDLPVTTTTEQGGGNTVTVSNATTISSGSVSVTYPEGVVLEPTGETNTTATVEQKLEYKGATLSTEAKSISVNSDEQAVASYELTLPVAETNTVLVPVTLQYEKGLTGVKVYHSGVELGTSSTDGSEYFTYDSSDGKLVLYLKHASPIDIVFDKPSTVTVTTADELKAALEDASVKTIKLGNDIELNTVLDVTHSVTIDFCGKTLSAKGDEIDKNQWVFEVYNNATSSNKLTFKDSSGTAGKFTSTYGGVLLCSDRAQFELNDVTMECNKGTAIAVYGIGFVVDASTGTSEYDFVLEDTSIVINSGKIVVAADGNGVIQSGNDNGGTGHTVTINGGEIECVSTYSGIYLNNNCTLTVNNCKYSKVGFRPFFFDSGNENCAMLINGVNYIGTGNVRIGSGDVTIYDIFAGYKNATNATLTINGGTFTVNDQTVSTTLDAE